MYFELQYMVKINKTQNNNILIFTYTMCKYINK